MLVMKKFFILVALLLSIFCSVISLSGCKGFNRWLDVNLPFLNDSNSSSSSIKASSSEKESSVIAETSSQKESESSSQKENKPSSQNHQKPTTSSMPQEIDDGPIEWTNDYIPQKRDY